MHASLQHSPLERKRLSRSATKSSEPKEASFDPPMTGPVPPDYVLGTGDTVRVQLFGNVNGIYEFDVTRDGILNLPEIGPVTVAGLPFSEFRADLNRRVKEMLIGTQVSVTMGATEGRYEYSCWATPTARILRRRQSRNISSALYRSGGISRVGSLRDIPAQAQRQGCRAARSLRLITQG